MSNTESAPQLVTVGVIATELDVPIDRVCRILRSRRDIRPAAYAGNVRLFSNESIEAVRREIDRIDRTYRHRQNGGAA